MDINKISREVGREGCVGWAPKNDCHTPTKATIVELLLLLQSGIVNAEAAIGTVEFTNTD